MADDAPSIALTSEMVSRAITAAALAYDADPLAVALAWFEGARSPRLEKVMHAAGVGLCLAGLEEWQVRRALKLRKAALKFSTRSGGADFKRASDRAAAAAESCRREAGQ